MENTKLEQLIKEAKVGNENAISELYENGKDSIYFTCLKLLNNSEDALDITQDTFLTVFEKINTLEDYNSYSSWQKTIAINKCKNYLIKNKPVLFTDNKIEKLIVLNIEDMDSEFIPHDYIDNLEKRNIIMDILDAKLSDVQRISTILFYYEEKSIKDISSILECSEGTVKSRLSSSRRIIKSEIEKIENKGIKLHSISGIPVLSLILQETAKNTIISQEISREIFKVIVNNLEVMGLISASVIGGTHSGFIAKIVGLIKSSTVAKIATTVIILTTVSATIALPFVINSRAVVNEDVKAGELVTPDKVEQAKPAEVIKPVEPELTTEEKEQAKQVIEPAVVSIPDGGAIANPNVNQSQTTTVVPDSRGPVEEPSKPTQQPEVVVPQQPVTPSRPSGAEMTNRLRGNTFNKNTNNSDVNSPLGVCTPTFLANAMPIIDSFIAGGLDEGSARSKLNSLNHTGDAVDDYGLTVITDIYSITFCNGTSPASKGISGIYDVAAYIGGAGVVNVTVTYDSSSDTYLTRGVHVCCGVQNK